VDEHTYGHSPLDYDSAAAGVVIRTDDVVLRSTGTASQSVIFFFQMQRAKPMSAVSTPEKKSVQLDKDCPVQKIFLLDNRACIAVFTALRCFFQADGPQLPALAGFYWPGTAALCAAAGPCPQQPKRPMVRLSGSKPLFQSPHAHSRQRT
jgi:hypothetical protein